MATPTYNKYKSTTIYGNLSVRDLTNSAGTSVIEVASVDLSGNFLSRGNSTFTKKVVCNALLADISGNNILTTKEYVDSVSGGTGNAKTGTTNTFTEVNTFSKKVICNATIEELTTGNCLTTKEYVITLFGDVLLSFQVGNNIWSGINEYTAYFPRSNLPTSTTINGYSIVNKQMNDTLYSSKTNEVKTNTANDFTSTNTFEGITNFINKIYCIDFIDQTQNLPSGKVNNFIETNFLELVNFSKGFSQDGTDTNNLNNLEIGNSAGDTITITAKSIKQFVNNLPATETNDLNNLSILTYLNVSGSTTTTGIVINSASSADNFTINGRSIVQNTTNTDTNSLHNLTIATNLTITNGFITQTGSTTNTLKNLQVDTISTISATLTNTSQNYSSVKMRNYIFHSRTTTTASGITLSTDTYLDDGQTLYIRKINTGVYTLTLTAGTSTTFLNLSNASVSTIALTGFTGVSFVYDKPNTRWIQLT